MKSGVALEAFGVSKRFGSKTVLNDLNFIARPGEFVAVVGRSGGGKSTLLRLVAGLDRPDRGSIRVDGEELTGLCSGARIMFQDGRLLPWLRVGDNVGLGLPKPDRVRVHELLRHVGLADRINDWPAILSGGQKQRVALARALAAHPGLLLLDEPLGSLDALTRLDMQRLIESLWLESGATAILVTHDVDEAITLADRIVFLAEGIAVEEWNVDMPRPRDRAHPRFALLEQMVLDRVMGRAMLNRQVSAVFGSR